jgi:WD40 repeat protein/tRNA A-37 threonylcarbamoyl transferase component Bud32
VVTPERWRRIEEVFGRALDVAEPERAAFLAAACDGDTGLRAEVESLLASASGASVSLHAAIAGAAATLAGDTGDPAAVAGAAGAIGTRLGPYQLVALLGEGGMGAVYLAERVDAEYRRQVAIKVLRHGLASPHRAARLRDERQVLAALDHPGIVRLLDGGRTADDQPYLVMEHVDGATFATYVAALSVRARVELAIRIANALQYAHGKLVVHRDVKPSNILVDRTGAPKLLDFGIAKLLGPDAEREAMTRTGMAMFTAEYASPEQVRGEAVSVATDVYSLGAVLYEALVGAPPQRAGKTWRETIANICDREPARASTAAPAAIRRQLAGDLDNILARALAKQPERRYASAAELADDLGRYLAGLPVAARDATAGYRARKFVRRHRGKLAIAVVVAAALVAATAASISAARRAERAAARADADRRALLVDRARAELATGHAARALPYLVQVRREGDDTAATRFLLAEALRPLSNRERVLAFPAGLAGIAWAPDGARFATAGSDGYVRIFAADGAQLRSLAAADARPTWPTWSPDGATLAAVTNEGMLTAWDAATGAVRLAVRAADVPGDGAAVSWLTFTRGGAWIVTSGNDASVRAWNVATGAPALSIAASAQVLSLAATPDGTRLVGGLVDGSLVVWDGQGAVLGTVTGAHTRNVGAVAISPDGERIYSSGHDERVRVWDATDPARLVEVGSVVGRGIELDGAGHFLTNGGDGIARICDARTGALVGELVGHEPHMALKAARYSPDGTRVVTTGVDNTFRVWDAATGVAELLIDAVAGAGDAAGSAAGTLDARLSPDGHVLAATADQVMLWRTDRRALAAAIPAGGWTWSAAYAPDERSIAAGGLGRAAILDAATGAVRAELPLGPGGSGRIYDVGWSPDGARLVVVGEPGLASVFTAEGTLVHALAGHSGSVGRGTYAPDGTRLATASGRVVRIFDAATFAEVRALEHPDHVMSAAWSRDGTRLATAGWDHRVRVWDAATGAQLVELDGGPIQFLDVTWSPDERTLAAAVRGGQVQLWDLAARRRTIVLDGHTQAVTAAVWSPDGALIATSSDDLTARIWDAATGALLATRRHPCSVMSAQWNRAGDRLLTACTDEHVYVWDVHRDDHTVAELVELLARDVPYRLSGGRLEHIPRAGAAVDR